MTIGTIRNRRRGLVAGLAVAALGIAAGATAFAGSQEGNTPPPAKQAILDRALKPPANPGPQAPKGPGLHAPPVAPPTPPAHAGEVGTPEQLGGVPVPFSPETFTVTTMWMDLRGQVEIHIYAGVEPSDLQQGALVVTRTNAVTGSDLPGAGEFPTPRKVGALTLTRVVGDTAYFTYSGRSGTFNIVSDRYSM